MSSRAKTTELLARRLFQLSLANGVPAPERVAGVLEYVERNRPAHAMGVLKAYRRLIAAELARSQAVIDHAGQVSDALLQGITAALGRKYGRALTASVRSDAALLAGLRVRVGDDVYESSVASQLAGLAAAV
jgi:F-type H+-transporting ATPase subunit delta